MNYPKIYNNLISRAKNRILFDYYERHHIVPKCVGGANCKNNIVNLTPEEHYLAHQILTKIYPNNIKIINAAMLMSTHNTKRRINNKLYGWLKRKYSKIKKDYFKTHKNKCTFKGRTHTVKSKEKIGITSKMSLRQIHQKDIYAFHLNGILFKKFDSISEAAEFVNTSPSNIKYCCEGKFNHIKRYRWSYKNNISNVNLLETLRFNKRKIKTPDGIFKSVTDVVKYYKFSSTKMVRDRCRSNKTKYKKWKYLDGPETMYNFKKVRYDSF